MCGRQREEERKKEIDSVLCSCIKIPFKQQIFHRKLTFGIKCLKLDKPRDVMLRAELHRPNKNKKSQFELIWSDVWIKHVCKISYYGGVPQGCVPSPGRLSMAFTSQLTRLVLLPSAFDAG